MVAYLFCTPLGKVRQKFQLIGGSWWGINKVGREQVLCKLITPFVSLQLDKSELHGFILPTESTSIPLHEVPLNLLH